MLNGEFLQKCQNQQSLWLTLQEARKVKTTFNANKSKVKYTFKKKPFKEKKQGMKQKTPK